MFERRATNNNFFFSWVSLSFWDSALS